MVLRRSMNEVGRISRDLKVPHLSKLMFKIKKSGYNERQMMEGGWEEDEGIVCQGNNN